MADELKIIENAKVSVEFTPAQLEITNYETIKKAIEGVADFYDKQIVTKADKKGAEASRSELISLEKQLDEERKRIKAIYSKPLNEYEEKMNGLKTIVQRPLNKIRDGLKEVERGERDERESILIKHMRDKSIEFDLEAMGIEAERIQESNPSWLNKGNFTQKGISTKLSQEIDKAIEQAVKDKKQRDANEQVLRAFCETHDIDPAGWLVQLDYVPVTEIIQTIQTKIKADKERLERAEREREELAELKRKNAETLQIEVEEQPIVEEEPIIMDTIQVRGTLAQLKAMNTWAVENGVEITQYEPHMALDDLPF